ncbi:aminotransferase class V-fold PLP-dependent enzyme [Taklimakanibacter deserti]|uniref:aminotransferase class V-fold PLP-dependent enzyme n=1 Tax=Taklimakanibacter deserti TaxID=2267839 RepID=UPI003F683507
MDLKKIRADTPAVARRAYLHNAGAALMPRPVVAAIKDHIDLEAEIGGYAAAGRESARCEAVYDSVARLLNAAPEEIALVENATVAWQMAFYSLDFAQGDRILTAEAEYAANYVAFLQMAKRKGVVIDVVPSDATGELDLEALERMIDARVKLIAMTWVPTNGGLTNPAAAIGRIARAHGILYLLDACQALGQMPADVEALGCDMLSGTGRKFLRGPRGTGFLYVRKSLLGRLEPPMIDHYAAPWVARDRYELRPDARRFENWENNYAARLGLGAAIDYALALGLGEIEKRCQGLSARLRAGLEAIDGLSVLDLGRSPSAIVSFTIDGIDAREVVRKAAEAGITIGASDPASTRIDAENRRLSAIVRASPHYYNTEQEVDRLVELSMKLRKSV